MYKARVQEDYLSGDFKLRGEFLSGGNYRESTLDRCEKYAGWTLPTAFPDEHLIEGDEMQNDYQSVGAQAVTNLANKIMMALFQPSKPFFRMTLSDKQKEVVMGSGMEEATLNEALAATERDAMHELDQMHARIMLMDTIVQLIITGNGMVKIPATGKMTAYTLRDYTLTRDLEGTMVKMIICETKSVLALSDELAAIAHTAGYGEKDEVSIYTGIQRIDNNQYMVWQELEDMCYCHKKIGIYNEDTLPWVPLVWKRARGKDYGTGLVEDYAGDFHTLSSLAEALLDYDTVITDFKNLVDPTGMTDARELTEAASGAYVHGREQDIFVHSADVSNVSDHLNVRFESVSRRIATAFLMTSAVTRDAERVTAAEIRQQASELEGSLGGVYTRLAHELQLPLAKRLLARLDDTFKKVEPSIVTGFESLSRNSDLDDFRAFMGDLILLADVPDEIKIRMEMGNVISILGAGHGIEYSSFLKDEETVKKDLAERAEANAQAAGQEAGAVTQAQQTGQPQ